ncbi:MAG: hypothetical protein V3T19_03245, partial [Acidiferrobacterales bacterium]
QVKGCNDDEERGPKYLFPSPLEYPSKDENASNRAEQTDNYVQQDDHQPTNELAVRPGSGNKALQ